MTIHGIRNPSSSRPGSHGDRESSGGREKSSSAMKSSSVMKSSSPLKNIGDLPKEEVKEEEKEKENVEHGQSKRLVVTEAELDMVSAAVPAVNARRLYMRKFSNVIRRWTLPRDPITFVDTLAAALSTAAATTGHDRSTEAFENSLTKRVVRSPMSENPIFKVDGAQRTILVTVCRIRQRILSQAWQKWVKSTGVVHDYEEDARLILQRPIPPEDLRSELEIEVLYHWAKQAESIDPTGIAKVLVNCSRRTAIYTALQQLRLEVLAPGEAIVFQGDMPTPADGHFTVFRGNCEVLQFPEESLPQTRLLYCLRRSRFDLAHRILDAAPIVSLIPAGAGFGELSTLTGVKRAATIRASVHPREKSGTNVSIVEDENNVSETFEGVEVVVLPAAELISCLESRGSEEVASTSETIDFLRQSGLTNRVSSKDLIEIAGSMTRRVLCDGEVLYYKGQPGKVMYLVVNGDVLLDTSELVIDGRVQPFDRASVDCCHLFGAGSILGDELLTSSSDGGDASGTYEASAVAVSQQVVVFAATGCALDLFADRLRSLRYSALFYRDRFRWTLPCGVAEKHNPYTYFYSLRRSIASRQPFRGARSQPPANKNKSNGGATKGSTTTPPNVATLTRNGATASGLRKNKLTSSGKLNVLRGTLITSNAELATGLSPDGEVMFDCLPRYLTGPSLQRLADVRKGVRRAAEVVIKNQAKESILYDQLHKTSHNYKDKSHLAGGDNDGGDTGISSDELRLRQSLRQYEERAQEERRKRREEAAKKEEASAGAAMHFLSPLRGMTYGNNTDSDNDPPDLHDPVNNDEGNNIHDIRDDCADLDGGGLCCDDSLRRDSADLSALGRTPLSEYFRWLDSLNLRAYRHLLRQAERTVEVNEALSVGELSKEKLTATVWADLADIFSSYGVTPHEIHIPWLAAIGQNITNDNCGIIKDNGDSGINCRSNEQKQKTNSVRFGRPRSRRESPRRDDERHSPSAWRKDIGTREGKSIEPTGTAAVLAFRRHITPDNRRVVNYARRASRFDIASPTGNALSGFSTQTSGIVHNPTTSLDWVDGYRAARSTQNTRVVRDLDLDLFLSSPDYFLSVISSSDVRAPLGKNIRAQAVESRYMKGVGGSGNVNTSSGGNLAVKKGVRTHLIESLEGYTRKDCLLIAEEMRKQIFSPYLRKMDEIDRRVYGHSLLPESILNRAEESELPNDIELSKCKYGIDINTDTATRPDSEVISRQNSCDASAMGEWISSASAYAPMNNESFHENSLNDKVLPEGETSSLKPHSGGLKHQPTVFFDNNVSSPAVTVEAGTIEVLTSPAPTSLAFLRPVDTRAPSRALADFEDFQREQAVRVNTTRERGYATANKLSRFKLTRPEPVDSLASIGMGRVYRSILRKELTLFKSLHPKASIADLQAFQDKFCEKYPEAKLQKGVLLSDAINSTFTSLPENNELAAMATDIVSKSEAEPISDMDIKSVTAAASAIRGCDQVNVELRQWIDFTIDCIRRNKEGERFTLPSINLNIPELESLTHRRLNHAKQAKSKLVSSGQLVKIHPKEADEPISGPPSYLTLHSTNFSVFMPAAAKQRVLADIDRRRK